MTKRLDQDEVAEAAALLRSGELVAFPTETVYGLGGLGLSDETVAAIFAAKGRPSDNPVILHVTDLDHAWPLWVVDEAQARRARAVAERFWPGPITIVLPASSIVPETVRAGLPKVAVRAPAHPVAQALLREVQPLAAPSANASGRPSPTTAAHVLHTLGGRIAAVLDGGATDVGVESTVVDLTDGARILRPGMVSEAELREVLSEVTGRAPGQPAHTEASPGLRHRHYAPAIPEIRLVDTLTAAPGDAVLTHVPLAHDGPVEVLPDDPDAYARGLFAALYRLERAGPPRLWIVRPPDGPRWAAVHDRLLRAVTPH